jgi:hypothetical protein
MEGMDVSFCPIPDVPSDAIYAFIKKKFLEHTGMDAIYILGSGLDALGIVERRLSRTSARSSCSRSRRVSGKFNGASTSASRSRAKASCWTRCRPSARDGLGNCPDTWRALQLPHEATSSRTSGHYTSERFDFVSVL